MFIIVLCAELMQWWMYTIEIEKISTGCVLYITVDRVAWWIFNNNNNTNNNNNSHFRHPLTKSSQSMCSNKTNTSKTLMNKNVLIQHVRKVTSDGWQLLADRALHDDCPLYMKWSQVKSDHEYVVGYMTGFWPIYNSFSWPYSNID